jgi:alpha-beta hydrolase superfamily lysophospholipase
VLPTPVRSSFFKELLAGLTAASGVGYLAACYTMSRWLTRAARGRPAKTPDSLGLAWEPLRCRTADGLRLAGWLIEPDRPRGTIALFHGLRTNRGQTLDRAAFLAEAGYRCVAFDHRAHGESEGRRTSFGFFEQRDVLAVLNLLGQRWPGQPRAALGLSMGAAAVCYAGFQAQGFDAIILESLYHDLASAFHSRIGNGFPGWLRRFVPGVVWMTERRLGLRLPHLAPVEHIPGLGPVPVLLLTGSADPHAPPADAERLHARCQGERELFIVPEAAHRDVLEVGGEAYRRRVLEFLQSRLPRRHFSSSVNVPATKLLPSSGRQR